MSVPAFMTKTGLVPVNPNLGVQGKYLIQGELCQIVHIFLVPGQKIQCEPGAMIYTADKVKELVKLGGVGRMLSGDGLFKAIYVNEGAQDGYVGLTANFPATIIPIDLNSTGGTLLCKHDAFLASMDPDCKVSLTPIARMSACACCFSGIPLFMQEVRGSGWAFVAAHGTIMTKTLAHGEEIVVDTHALVAMSGNISVDVVRTGGCSVICCGGAGLFNTTLKGPGIVYLCSMPMEKLRALFPRPAPKKKNQNASATAVAVANSSSSSS